MVDLTKDRVILLLCTPKRKESKYPHTYIHLHPNVVHSSIANNNH